jgi:hypothetical protein
MDIYDYRTTYVRPYPRDNYKTDLTKNFKPTENIYTKDHMHEAMKKLLANDKNEIKKLNNGTFGINLSKEDGFA